MIKANAAISPFCRHRGVSRYVETSKKREPSRRIKRDPIYADTEPTQTTTAARSDEFYGKALATVVRTILERRAAANLGAAPTDVIYAAMKAGGFLFDAKNDDTAKRSLSTSLAKNTTTFHRLPNGDFGLLEWYPNIPTKTRSNGKQAANDEEGAAQEVMPETSLDKPYPHDFAEKSAEPGGGEKKWVQLPVLHRVFAAVNITGVIFQGLMALGAAEKEHGAYPGRYLPTARSLLHESSA